MRIRLVRTAVGAAVAVLLAAGAAGAAGTPPTLAALGEDGELVVFRVDRPETTRVVRPSGLSGHLLGIDFRPADGRIYGLASTNEVYRIDPATGAATLASTLIVPFDGDARSGVDFTPQNDRLRLLGTEGQNLRVHVGLGAVAVDRPLAFAPADANAGRRPRIAAAGYTNNVAGAATTKLFEIEADLDILVVQDPPNDGILTTVGALGVDFDPRAGFEIVSEREGVDEAWAVDGTTLYAIDLETGRATPRGTVGAPGLHAIGLAVVPGRPAP